MSKKKLENKKLNENLSSSPSTKVNDLLAEFSLEFGVDIELVEGNLKIKSSRGDLELPVGVDRRGSTDPVIGKLDKIFKQVSNQRPGVKVKFDSDKFPITEKNLEEYEHIRYKGVTINRYDSDPYGFSELKYRNNYLRGGDKLTVKILDASSNNIVDDLKKEFFENKCEVLVFQDVLDVLNNHDVLDFLLINKVRFTSVLNATSAESLSEKFIGISIGKEISLGGNRKIGQMNKNNADLFAEKIGPKLDELENDGLKTLAAKADFLNKNKIYTSKGKEWTSMTVKRTLERWHDLKPKDDDKPTQPKP